MNPAPQDADIMKTAASNTGESNTDAANQDGVDLGSLSDDLMGFPDLESFPTTPAPTAYPVSSYAVPSTASPQTTSDSESPQSSTTKLWVLGSVIAAGAIMLLTSIIAIAFLINRGSTDHTEDMVASLDTAQSLIQPIAPSTSRSPLEEPEKATESKDADSAPSRNSASDTLPSNRAKDSSGPASWARATGTPEMLTNYLKGVTVSLTVHTHDGMLTGTGFLFSRDTDKAYVITNSELVDDADPNRTISCYFRTGKVKVIGKEATIKTNDQRLRVAILEMDSEGLPEGLDSGDKSALAAGTEVGIGFLDTVMVGPNHDLPRNQIVISRNRVSTVHVDSTGRPEVIEFTRPMKTRVVGGAVISDRIELIGMAVPGSTEESPGFAIPRHLLADLVANRLQSTEDPHKRIREILRNSGNVTVKRLPNDCVDFAIDPTSGGVVALDAKLDRAYWLSRDYLDDQTDQEPPWVPVGRHPISVTHKGYGDKAFFVVASDADPALHLIDTETFQVVQQISVAAKNIIRVSSSVNPQDPFVYYSYRSDQHAAIGVADLRSMSDLRNVRYLGRDGSVSADGHRLYVRDAPHPHWMRSGQSPTAESRVLVNTLTDARPEFRLASRTEYGGGGMIPDPWGSSVAIGSTLYDRGMSQKKRSTHSDLACFFSDRPFFAGISNGQSRLPRTHSPVLVIGAVSDGRKVAELKIPSFLGAKVNSRSSRSLGRGLDSARISNVVGRVAMYDETKQRIFLARGDQIACVPIDTLDLPDEPLMTLASSNSAFQVGREQTIPLVAAQPNVSIQISDADLPAGMQATGDSLRWTPGADDIGQHTIPVTLKRGSHERARSIDVNVSHPSIASPHAITGMAIDPRQRFAIVWKSPPLSHDSMMDIGT